MKVAELYGDIGRILLMIILRKLLKYICLFGVF